MGSHFRKYILLGSTRPTPAQFNKGGCSCWRSDQLSTA